MCEIDCDCCGCGGCNCFDEFPEPDFCTKCNDYGHLDTDQHISDPDMPEDYTPLPPEEERCTDCVYEGDFAGPCEAHA